MRVYVDSNVLIDYVCQRKEFADTANRIIALGYMGKVDLQTSALSYVTAMYVAHKYEYQNVKASLLALSDFVNVLDLQASTVLDMLSADWTDYEDATQHATALRANAACIVTRNKKDFTKSPLPTYTPTELLELLNNKDHLA